MAEFDPDKYLARKKKSEEFDPDKYLASTKPETALQTLGRSTASLADSALNAITGTLDYGAYALARAAGRPPEQATQETTSPKDVIGRMTGVTGTPGYENAPLRRLGTAVGETVNENVVRPVASATGLPEQDVANMFNTATMAVAPAIPKVVKPAVQAGKAGAQAVGDVASGALGRATGYIAKPGEQPVGYQVPSSRIPLSDKFTTPEDWAKFQRGEMPYGQFPPETPIQQLPTNALERTALKLSGGEIPAQGQAARAFGERIGETYRNPVTAAIDVGSMFATGGVPVLSAARGALAGVQGVADYMLSRKGFDPSLPAKMEAYKSGQIPMPGRPQPAPGPVAPQATPNYPLTVQGPGQQVPPSVMPMGGPQRTVNIEGQSFNLPHQINTSQVQTARAPQASTPVPDLAQLAAQRSAAEASKSTNQIQQQAGQKVNGPVNPDDILAQIRARGQQPQPQPQTQPQPQATGSLFNPDSLSGTRWTPGEKLSLNEQLKKLQQQPQKSLSAVDEAKAKKEMAKQSVEASKTYNESIIKDFANHGTSEMIDMIRQTTPIDMSKTVYNESNATRGMANYLVKNYVDSIPVLEGMTEAQVVHAIYKEMTRKGNPSKKAPSNVSQMMIGEPKGKLNDSLLSKRSFNSDLQKYRYGSEKNPLTMEEFNHLKQSDYLEHQNMRDRLMDMRPDLTEYSIWYKDKTGKIHNIQTHGGELDKFRKTK